MRTALTSVILCTFTLGLALCRAQADVTKIDSAILDRDSTYEEDLRWEASDDKTMTPARAIRWLEGIRGSAVFDSVSSAEFTPIVNVNDSRVKIVGAIIFKFK